MRWTGSTTRCSKNHPSAERIRVRTLINFSLLSLLILANVGAAATEIHIHQVNGKTQADFYFIDTKLDIALNASAREALASGVPLTFVFDIEIVRPQRYLWDQTVLTLRRPFTLQRHALAKRFLVTDVTTDRHLTVGSIDEALSALGAINDITISRSKDLPIATPLRGRLRVQLDIESLPAPLRPIAYISPRWHIRSAWYEWNVTP